MGSAMDGSVDRTGPRAFVRTVLGDIAPEELGVCDAHEHIIIDAGYPHIVNPELKLDSVENAVTELREFHRHGGRSMVDTMPCDSGRNILKLAEISRRTGVHILASTGLHLEKYYIPGHWRFLYSEDELADLFIRDIETGVDAHDYNGPLVRRKPHKAGLIKVATAKGGISDHQRLVFRAAAQAHRKTGAPLLTHTQEGDLSLQQVSLLKDLGVDVSHVVLSHTDANPDAAFHRDLLQTGVCVEYDRAFRWKNEEKNPTVDLIRALLPDFPGQILLGMDAARYTYWKSYGGGPGLSYLITTFRATLERAGLGEFLDPLFVDNPRNTYSFVV